MFVVYPGVCVCGIFLLLDGGLTLFLGYLSFNIYFPNAYLVCYACYTTYQYKYIPTYILVHIYLLRPAFAL